jgi:hypothetical protein
MAAGSAKAARPADPRPLGGYGVLLGTYSLSASFVAWYLRDRQTRRSALSAGRFIVLALATQHLSRLITKDSITAPLRRPFTRFVGATGEGEVDEEVIGAGLRRAIGELLTCPYCIGQWVASGLVAGLLAAPDLTEALATACALARVSDYLQLAYDQLKNQG